MKKIKKISFIIAIIAIIISIIGISNFESITKVVSKTNKVKNTDAGYIEEGTTGVIKNGTVDDFTNDMPYSTAFFDADKADTTIVGENGYTLNTENQYIVKKEINKMSGSGTESRVTYLGPSGEGIPAGAEGYVTNSGISTNASEDQRTKFTMKFDDVVTMQDSTKRDVLITISNIYIVNQRTGDDSTIPLWIGWKGNGLAVYARHNDEDGQTTFESQTYVQDDITFSRGFAMHCDISMSVIDEEGNPIEGEKILLKVIDLDVEDKTRTGSLQNAYAKADDERYNQGLTPEQKLTLYDSDYRESIYILNGAVSDAYIPETNWLEVKRLSAGEYANGLRFSSLTGEQDSQENGDVNTGFYVLVDSAGSSYRWYGSSTSTIMGTVLFTNVENHQIKATNYTEGNASSIGGSISNYIEENEIIANSDNCPGYTYQHNFADGVTVNYLMNAKTNYYMKNIKVDNVEFLPSDFSNVSNGEQDKQVTITKGQKQYKFKVTKDSNGKITKALYIFEKNNADHEISVVWETDEVENAEYTVEYYYDGIIDDTATETDEAPIGSIVNSYTDKNKTGYHFVKDEGKPLTIDEDSDKNIIKVYYEKDSDENAEYTVEYYYDGEKDNTATVKSEAKIGSIVDSYTDKNKTGYHFVKDEGKPLTIDEDSSKNIIKVYYEKDLKGSVIVKYIDIDTGKEISEKETITGTVGESYTSKEKDISGYIYVKNSGNTSGKITEKDINVIYYYKTNTKTPTEEVSKLPKTGNTNNFIIIIAIVALMGIIFAIRYHKFRDIK